MKQLYTLPEHYLRYLLEANAEDAQLKCGFHGHLATHSMSI